MTVVTMRAVPMQSHDSYRRSVRLLDGLAWTIDCDGSLKEHRHCGGHSIEELLPFRVLGDCQ